MRVFLLLVLLAAVALAQTAVPQAVAWVHSPTQLAFKDLTPALDFAPEVVAKVKSTEPGQVFKLIVTHEPILTGTTPGPITITVSFDQVGWSGISLGLPAGYKVKATGGVTIQVLLPSGPPLTVPTAQ